MCLPPPGWQVCSAALVLASESCVSQPFIGLQQVTLVTEEEAAAAHAKFSAASAGQSKGDSKGTESKSQQAAEKWDASFWSDLGVLNEARTILKVRSDRCVALAVSFRNDRFVLSAAWQIGGALLRPAMLGGMFRRL